MNQSKETKKALLPVKKTVNPVAKSSKNISPLNIADKLQHLKNREEVRKYLPDILGRVLARIWIDSDFRDQFASNPQRTLEINGVYLPDEMIIEFQKPNSDRPRIVVYEKKKWF